MLVYKMSLEHDHDKQNNIGTIASSHAASQRPNQRIVTPPLQRVRVQSKENPQMTKSKPNNSLLNPWRKKQKNEEM